MLIGELINYVLGNLTIDKQNKFTNSLESSFSRPKILRNCFDTKSTVGYHTSFPLLMYTTTKLKPFLGKKVG